MSQQIQITGGAKVRNLNGVITGSTGVLDSLPINGANGIPQLDSNGKILVSQLPNSVMEYKGMWNVATNTPYLVNGTGNAGDVYLVTGAATGGTSHDFGAGPITFYNSDQVIYDGTNWDRASGSSGTVTSVALTMPSAFSVSGSPVTNSGTLAVSALGTTSQYINGAGGLTTFPSLTGFVPYTGATSDVDLGTHKLSLNSEQFASISAPTYSEGALWYDSTQKALAYYNDISGNILHLGQEVQLKVHNNTGSTIAKGAPVYVTSTSSGYSYPNVALAKADTLTTANVIGLANQAIPNGTDGYITLSGLLTGANTGSFTVGDVLYLSPYSAGQLMNTMPPTGYAVRVGVVSYSNTPNGTIYINQSNAYSTAANIVGTIQISQGGTGATTAGAALTNLGAQAQLNGTGFVKISGTTISYDNSTYYLASNPNNYIPLTALSASSPLSYNNTTGVFSISQANNTANGYLSSIDWATFNSKQAALNGTGFVKISGTTISYDNSTYYLASNPNNYITLTSLSGGTGISYNGATGVITSTITQYTDAMAKAAISNSAPITYNSSTGVIGITQSTSTSNGYLSSGDWITFNSKQNLVGLTTTGNSGSATFNQSTGALNIPTYTLAGLGGQPQLNGTGFVKISGTTISYDNSTYLTTSSAASTYVSYSGAITALNLGTNNLTSNAIFTSGTYNGGIYLTQNSTITSDVAGTTYTSIKAYSTRYVYFDFGQSSSSKTFRIDANGLTSGTLRTYTAPDNSGTLALTSDIPSVAGVYLPLAGGTLTGTLNGTSATFSSTISASNFSGSSSGTNTGDQTNITGTAGNITATSNSTLTTLSSLSLPYSQLTGTPSIPTVSGTANYIPKFTGTSSIGNSIIQDDGTNVGIGVAPSTYKLSVAGVIKNNDDILSTNGTVTSILSYSTSSGGASVVGSVSNHPLRFFTNSTTKMTLDASGNLGLGVTPSAWYSTFQAFQFGANGSSIFGRSENNMAAFASNAYVNSAGNFTYINTNTASYYQQLNGQHQWYNAPSGTAGSAISFTQAMTLFASGNLALNTTTDSGYKLDVNGTGRFSGNVAIGSSSSTPATSEAALFFGSSNYLNIGAIGTDVFFNNNAYYNGSIWKYINTNPASDYYQSNGTHVFRYAASGTAGGTITWNTALSLANTGAATFSSSVGIGGQTPTYGGLSGLYALQSGNASYYSYDQESGLVGNAYYSSGWKYKTSNYASRYMQNVGIHTWFTATSGTADGSLSWSEKMRITNDGNVGIGTTSPRTILDVSGIITQEYGNVYQIKQGSTEKYYYSNGASYDAFSTGVMGIGTTGDPIQFATSNAIRATITSGGNVGIGTTSPTIVSGFTDLTIDGSSGSFIDLRYNGFDNGRFVSSAGIVGLQSLSTTPLTFNTNGSERMRITSGGNVLIGTTTDSGDQFQVKAGASKIAGKFSAATTTNQSYGIYIAGGTSTSDYAFYVNNAAESSFLFKIDGVGNVKVNNLGTGLVYSNSGTLTSTNPSDNRLKENVKDISWGLSDILKLRPVSYSWKDDRIKQGVQFGFIAQEVKEVMPQAIKEFGEEKYLGLEKDAIYATLVKAIQELNERIIKLENK